MPHKIALLLLATLLAPAASRTALAHAILMESTPALRATVAAGAVMVTLRFNSRIDAARSQLLLIRADRSQAVLPIRPGTAPELLETQADIPPGEYVIRWQVLAVDGHITRGDVPFTVRAP